MKSENVRMQWKKWAAVAVMSLSCPQALAGGGGSEVGGGGDFYGLEFKKHARNLVGRMEIVGQWAFRPVDLKVLRDAIETTTVVTVEVPCKLSPRAGRACPPDQVRDAVNFKSLRLIQLGKTAWPRIKLDPEALDHIVLHELYGIVGIEKDVDGASRSAVAELRPARSAMRSQGRFEPSANRTDIRLGAESQCLNRCDQVSADEHNFCLTLRYEADRLRCVRETGIGARAKDCYDRCESNPTWLAQAIDPALSGVAPSSVGRPLTTGCQAVEHASLQGIPLQRPFAAGTPEHARIQAYLKKGMCNDGDASYRFERFEQREAGFKHRGDRYVDLHELDHKDGQVIDESNYASENVAFRDVVAKAFLRVAAPNQVEWLEKVEQFHRKKDSGMKKNGLVMRQQKRFFFDAQGKLTWIETAYMSSGKELGFLSYHLQTFEVNSRRRMDPTTTAHFLDQGHEARKEAYKRVLLQDLK